MSQNGQDAPKLTDLMDADALTEILDVFATVTHTTVSICGRDGKPICRPSGQNPFCRLMLDSKAGRQACRRSHQAALARAADERKPISLTCHAGLIQYAAAVVMDGQLLATIVMGDLPSRPLDRQTVDALAETYQIDRGSMEQALGHVRPWSDEQMSAAVEFLQLLANTLARFCQQENQLRLRVDELATVYELTSLLAGDRDLDAVLRITARNVANVLRVKACSIRLLNRETGELKIAAGHNLSEEYLNKGAVKVEENPIDRAALDGETVYIADVGSDPRIRFPDQARKEGLVSGLVTGMVFRGQTVGVMRVYTGQRQTFTGFEASLLRVVAAQAAAAIENRRLTAEAIRSEIVSRQVAAAAEVQRRMVPIRPPAHPHLEFGSVYEPTYELAGDFYDFLELDGGLVGLAIADVVGKGVAASLLMASVRSALRAWANGLGPVDEIIGQVNRQLCRDTLPQEFATLFYGVFSADGRRLSYCNAGHDWPLLVRGGQVRQLDVGGMLIGTVPDAAYKSGEIDLMPGDVILFYTDGVVDAMNFVDERFGRDQLARSLIRYAPMQADAIAPNILWDVRRFVGLADQVDDITMVSVKVSG